jgi:hypothetical protein
MRNFVTLLGVATLSIPTLPAASYACITSVICATGQTNYALMRQQREHAQIAQYMPTQYYPAQMMGGGGSPVIVPPTVINTQGYEHNSSKKSCKESVIDMFLFSVRRTTGDCTP